MSEGQKPPMPTQPTTAEFPAPPGWAIALTEQVAKGFAELRGDVTLLVEEGKATNQRIGVIEHRVSQLEEARRTDSTPARVRSVTDNDSKQDAAIAQLVTTVTDMGTTVGSLDTRVGAVETKVTAIGADITTIKKAVTGFLTNPKVRLVGRVIFVLAAGYAAAKGIKVLP